MPLRGKVAVVTGASRGLGKGIAFELASAGALVIVTSRTLEPDGSSRGSLQETADAIRSAGGLCDCVRVDHGDDAQVAALFSTVADRYGRLDILVNNVYCNPALSAPAGARLLRQKFWEVPLEAWDVMHRVGLRSHYVASVLAVPLLLRQPGGLIINISSWGGRKDVFTVAYGVVKAGVDRLAQGLAAELREHGVTAVSLYPGLVDTEMTVDSTVGRVGGRALLETPRYTGRAILAIARDPERLCKTGRTLVVAELAREYGFVDIDGRQPPPLDRLEPRD
jgi:dehydrogenase/reductase SDR family protein 1